MKVEDITWNIEIYHLEVQDGIRKFKILHGSLRYYMEDQDVIWKLKMSYASLKYHMEITYTSSKIEIPLSSSQAIIHGE